MTQAYLILFWSFTVIFSLNQKMAVQVSHVELLRVQASVASMGYYTLWESEMPERVESPSAFLLESERVSCSIISDCDLMYCPWGFSRQEYWSRLPFPPPGDFPTQGSNTVLLHFGQILYHLSHQGSLLEPLGCLTWAKMKAPWTSPGENTVCFDE